MNIVVYIATLLVSWLVMNILYRFWIQRSKFKSIVDLKYFFILLIRKHYTGVPRSKMKKLHMLFAAILYFAILVFSVYIVINMIYTGLFRGARGTAVILLPGYNIIGEDLLLFLVSVGLGVVIHEYLHAQIVFKTGVPVNSFGFILAFIFPAAFVEIDEEVFAKTTKLVKISVLAAGVLGNLLLYLVVQPILLTTTSLTGIIVVGVDEGSLAEKHGLKPNDVIYGINVNNTRIDPIELGSYLKSYENSTLIIEIEMYRSRVGWRNITIIKEPFIERLGIKFQSIAPSQSIVQYIDPGVFLWMFKLLLWIMIVNGSIMIINSLPLFITDGGKIIIEVLGEKYGKVVNTITLILLILTLAFTATI